MGAARLQRRRYKKTAAVLSYDPTRADRPSGFARRRRRPKKRRADRYAAAILPAEPALAGRREDRAQDTSDLLRLRRPARARRRGWHRRPRLPRPLAALTFVRERVRGQGERG